MLLDAQRDFTAGAGRITDMSLGPVARRGDERIALHAVPFPDGDATLLAVETLAPRGGTLIGVLRNAAVESLLADLQTGLGESILIVDANGQVIHGRKQPGQWVPMALLNGAATAEVRDYTNAAGLHVIHTAMALGLSGWYVAVEAPYDIVFEPVVSVVKRIFVIDLCIVVLFSLIAFKITTAIVKPIQALSDGAARIAQGQLDHEIPDPETNDEIGTLTRTFNEMMRRLRGNQAQIESANQTLLGRNVELEQANEILEQLSITDGLTKLHNHRFFQDQLTREIKRVNRLEKPLSMILVDIDDFKGLNDRLGHAAGDELLRRLARLLNECVRETDLVARYGGEEFVVLAPDTDIEGARLIAEKIRTAVAESSFILDDSLRPMRSTVSIGVAQFLGNRKRFFTDADRALYQAKAEGKNCVVVDENSVAT
jgi:diguanylate cyclase (GGDEF)-like protein